MRHLARSVWARDEGRCAFVGTVGRCVERGFLEVHHVTPYVERGEATTDNLELRCRAHNAYELEQDFRIRARSMLEEISPPMF